MAGGHDPVLVAALLGVLVAWAPGTLQPGQLGRQFALIVGCLLLAGDTLVRRPPVRPLGRGGPWLLLAWPAAVAIVGVVRMPSPMRTDTGWDAVLLALPWLFALLVWRRASTDERHDRVEAGVCLSALWASAAIGLTGILQYWAGLPMFEQARPPAATFVNRNVAAQALVAILPLALAALPGLRTQAARWAGLAAVGAGVALAVATRTRAAWAALLVGLLVGAVLYVFASPRRRVRAVAGTAAFMAACALVAALVPAPRETRLPGVVRTVRLLAEGGEKSGEIRAALRANTAAMIRMRPLLGHGPGLFPVAYVRFHAAVRPTPEFGVERHPLHAHADALEYAAELGIPAAAMLALFLVGGALGAARQALRAQDAVGAARAAARAAAVTGVLLHGLFSFPLRSPASASLAIVAAALGWISQPRAGGRRVVEAGIVMPLLVLLLLAPRVYRAEREIRDAVAWQARGDCRRALPAARRAMARTPNRETAGIAAAVVFSCETDPVRSLVPLEQALARWPGNPNLLLSVGARRTKAGDLAGAEAAFRQATELLPDLGRAWFGLALVADRRGLPERAAAHCRRALADPGLPAEARSYCRAVTQAPTGRVTTTGGA
ncbi:MAG: hypothetical protein Kow0062_02450 [Acidobacteriota bacterium]